MRRNRASPAWLAVLGLLCAAGAARADGWSQQQRLTPAPRLEYSQFGNAVSICGDRALVGAWDYPSAGPGRAYVFKRDGTTWSEEAALFPSTPVSGTDRFGSGVSLDGNTAVVGAWGAAYVFEHDGTSWTQAATFAGAGYTGFGRTVSVSGDTVLVHSRSAAYIFEKPAGGWVDTDPPGATAKLSPSHGGGMFSATNQAPGVCLEGDTALVGDRGYSDWQGQAYIFEKPSGGWADMTETARLTASDAETGDYLGTSVCLSGDTAIVGASRDDWGGMESAGSAYVFEKPTGGWAHRTEDHKLTVGVADAEAYDAFGCSVSIDGNTAVVGASGEGVHGAAYVFERTVAGWSEEAKLTNTGTGVGGLGESVAIDGHDVIAGAPFTDLWQPHPQPPWVYDVGAAYVFVESNGNGELIPEPGALGLVGLGLVGLVRRKSRQ